MSLQSKLALCCCAVAVTLAGCAVNKDWVAAGGSRADGTVKLAYEYGEFQKPMVSRDQAVRTATDRCAAWGYTGAEPFGEVLTNCINGNAYGCNVYRVTAEFQCTGQPDRPR